MIFFSFSNAFVICGLVQFFPLQNCRHLNISLPTLSSVDRTTKLRSCLNAGFSELTLHFSSLNRSALCSSIYFFISSSVFLMLHTVNGKEWYNYFHNFVISEIHCQKFKISQKFRESYVNWILSENIYNSQVKIIMARPTVRDK